MDVKSELLLGCILLLVSHTESLTRVKRIIGGDTVSERSHVSWMVRMMAKVPLHPACSWFCGYTETSCGGTLISDRWVVSAAHCFDGKATPSHWHARMASLNHRMTAGEAFLNIFGKIFGSQDLKQMEFHPEQIIMHPGYDSSSNWKNDIALIKLRESVPLSDGRVSKLQVATPMDRINGQTCTAYGWGCRVRTGAVTPNLMEVSLKIVDDRDCSWRWSNSLTTRICAGGQGNGRSVCYGDSGGPLVCADRNGNEVLTGIASFIDSVGTPGHRPNVFTEVVAFRQWIHDRTGVTI